MTLEEVLEKISKYLPVGHSYRIRDSFFPSNSREEPQRCWDWWLYNHLGYPIKFEGNKGQFFDTPNDALANLANYPEKTYGDKQ